MGCGTSKNPEFYIEATRSVQTSPSPWDHQHMDDNEYEDNHGSQPPKSAQSPPWENLEFDHSNPSTTTDRLFTEESKRGLSDLRLSRATPIMDTRHDDYPDQGSVVAREATTNVLIVGDDNHDDDKRTKLTVDHQDEGYKTDSGKIRSNSFRGGGVNHYRNRRQGGSGANDFAEKSTERHHRRKRRSRRRTKSDSGNDNVRRTVSHDETSERKRHDSKQKNAEGDNKYNQHRRSDAQMTPVTQASSPSSTATSSTLASGVGSGGFRVAGGKNRTGQPPPPWRHHYTVNAPNWKHEYLTE